VLTTFIFGYTCHQNIFAVTNELSDPTPERVDKVQGTARHAPRASSRRWVAFGTREREHEDRSTRRDSSRARRARCCCGFAVVARSAATIGTPPRGPAVAPLVWEAAPTCRRRALPPAPRSHSNRSNRNVAGSQVITRAVGTAVVVYLIVATAGYITFGDNVMPDILNNYPGTKVGVGAPPNERGARLVGL
jgi:hypothetical protein